MQRNGGGFFPNTNQHTQEEYDASYKVRTKLNIRLYLGVNTEFHLFKKMS